MNELWGHLIGVMIVFMIVCFLGMWIWVWQKKHKPVFDQLSSIPMEDAREEHEANELSEENIR